MFDNPVLFAITAYGLTTVIALGVAGIIWIICCAIRFRGQKVAKEQK